MDVEDLKQAFEARVAEMAERGQEREAVEKSVLPDPGLIVSVDIVSFGGKDVMLISGELKLSKEYMEDIRKHIEGKVDGLVLFFDYHTRVTDFRLNPPASNLSVGHTE